MDTSGIRLKLDRARVHIVALGDAVKEYRAGTPYRFTTTHEQVDAVTRIYRLHASVREQPPPTSGPIIGDAVHNIRSALDHAVWEVADPARRGDHTMFPIVTDSDRWEGATRHRLAGVPERHVELTKASQPFVQIPDEPQMHPLAVLRELSNIDKHRTLHTLAVVSADEYVGAGSSDVEVVAFNYVGGATRYMVQDGDQVLRFTARLKDPDAEWGIDPHADYNVAIEGTFDSMLRTLRRSLDVTQQVIVMFENPDAPWLVVLPTDV
jgi:hypothetical protein